MLQPLRLHLTQVLLKMQPHNDATLTLGNSMPLLANKAIVVDQAAPIVTNVTSTKANGSYYN